jgi:hypothetical protein
VALRRGGIAPSRRWLRAVPSSSVLPIETQMPDPTWKSVWRDPHALGWVLFMLLMLAIGFAVVYLGL